MYTLLRGQLAGAGLRQGGRYDAAAGTSTSPVAGEFALTAPGKIALLITGVLCQRQASIPVNNPDSARLRVPMHHLLCRALLLAGD